MGIFGGARRAVKTAITGPWAEENARDILIYETLVTREAEQDSMMWQVPALALTGQAFLLTIAFDPAFSFYARIITSALGVLLAFASLQVMAKHHYLAEVDRARMSEIETKLGMGSIALRKYKLRRPPKRRRWMGWSSYRIWRNALFFVLLVNLSAVAYAITEKSIPVLV